MHARAALYGKALAPLPDQINKTADFLKGNIARPTPFAR
jgi:hypothetical protein